MRWGIKWGVRWGVGRGVRRSCLLRGELLDMEFEDGQQAAWHATLFLGIGGARAPPTRVRNVA